jgi:hypothetical protein
MGDTGRSGAYAVLSLDTDSTSESNCTNCDAEGQEEGLLPS